MVSRFVRFVTSLATVVFAYFAYRLVLVPFIEPAAKPRAVAGEASWTTSADARTQELQALFPPGSWELNRPKVLDTDRAVLLLRDLRELDPYRIELKPCTLILFSGGGEDRQGARPVILQAAQGAVLTFAEPINLARGQIGHLDRGSLPGEVTIRSPESRPGAGDQFEVVTHNVQLARDQIKAPQPLRFRYGPSYGSGRDLIIYLTTPAGMNLTESGSPRKNRVPLVSAAELVHVDRIRLQLDNPRELASTAQAKAEPPAESPAPSLQVEITCQGPFKFDFAGKVATFHDHVDVLRMPAGGPLDQLNCQQLSIYFATSSDRPKSGGKPAGSATPDLQGLQVERIQARGAPAVLQAPSYAATLRAELFEYNFLTRQVRIEDGQKLLLRYQQYDVEARQLEYQFAAGGGLGRLQARGPGHAYGTLPGQADRPEAAGQTLEVAWNDRVMLQPHQGDHALSVLGGGTLRMHGEGEFAARDLHLWINESPDPEAPRGQPRFRYRPLRMLAEGDVRVDSWQLAGTTQRAEVWIRHEDAPEAAAATAGPKQSQDPAQRRRSNQKFELAADHLQTQLVRRGQETIVEHLVLDGQVRLREVRTEKAGDVPLAIVGDLVQVDHANTTSARVHVKGRPSEVSARGLTVAGDTIQLSRGENRIWIDSPGKMLLPVSAQRRGAGPGPAADSAASPPLSVAWGGRLDFDGRTARFLRDVHVSGVQRSQQGEVFDLLVMGHELAVTLNQKADLSSDKPPQNLDVQELAFVGGVYLQNTGRLAGSQTSYDQLQVRDLTIDQSTGRLHAYGPGWGSSVRYDQGLAEKNLNPASPDEASEPRLVYLRVDYEDEAVGNVLARELEFRGRVRTLYGPVEAWDKTLDPNPAEGVGRGQYLLTSDQLAIADAAARVNGQEAGLELTALGNASIEGQAFSARAWRVAYAKAKELVILEGDGRADAELWRKGSTTPDAAAQQIRFWTNTQSIQVDGGRFLNLGQVAGSLELPKR